MNFDGLSDALIGPLVGLGTAFLVYAAWLVFHRVLPPVLQVAHGLWIVFSVAMGLVGFWLTPTEGHFPSAQVEAWQARRASLAACPAWASTREVWGRITALREDVARDPARIVEHLVRLEALREDMGGVVRRLQALEQEGLLSQDERRTLAGLAVQRLEYLQQRISAPPPESGPVKVWREQMERLESRFRFLGRIEEVPASRTMLWQQRVRLSREIAMLDAILDSSAACESGSAECSGALAREAARGGPAFDRVNDEQRSVALLASDLSLPAPPEAARCPGQAGSGCGSWSAGACGSAKPACGARAGGGCCSE